jgi:hypothetical protein
MSKKGCLVLMAIGCPSARQNQAGLVTVAFPVEPQKFDGLSGSWLQAIVLRMRMADNRAAFDMPIRITETKNYLILQFYGEHGPECHSRPMMSGRNSGPAQRAFKKYLSAGGAAENEE